MVTIKLSDSEARLVWGILDGAADAGACEGGLSQEEHQAVWKAIDQIVEQTVPKRKAIRARKGGVASSANKAGQMVTCEHCDGKGERIPGSECPDCHGRGYL